MRLMQNGGMGDILTKWTYFDLALAATNAPGSLSFPLIAREGVHLPDGVGHVEHVGLPARQVKSPTPPSGKTNLETFISQCTEAAAPFFSELLTTAQDKGFIVNWGTKGISIRVRRPNGRLQSVFYGFFSESKGRKHPRLQAYLAEFSAADGVEEIRRRFLGVASFEPRGQYTLELLLEPRNVQAAVNAQPAFWSVMEELAHKPMT